MFIFNLKKKEVERFEPNGSYSRAKDKEKNDIDTLFKKIFYEKLNFNYIQPSNICPLNGFQFYNNISKNKHKSDPQGFCAAWSLWYADLRMANPTLEQSQLIKLALEKIKKLPISFRSFIRNYANFLLEQQIQTNIKINRKQILKKYNNFNYSSNNSNNNIYG